MKLDINWVSCVEAADTAYCLEEPLQISGYELRNSLRAVALKVVRKGTPVVVRVGRGRGRPKKVVSV